MTEAFSDAVLSGQVKPELLAVTSVGLSKWEPYDPSKRNTLLVTYRTGLRDVREWLTPEHTGYARTKFEHRCRTEWKIEPPATIKDAIAMQDVIQWPSAILVRPSRDNPRYLDVLRRLYE